MNKLSLPAAALGAALLAAGAAVPAAAQSLLVPTGGNCTGNNCNATQLTGRVANEDGFAVPLTVQVRALAGRCLRLETLSQDVDLEMVVLSPNGSILFRNDNKGGRPCPQCSLVKISGTQAGFYTVHLSSFSGAAVSSDVRLSAGLYNGANANCNRPTPEVPAAAAGASAKG